MRALVLAVLLGGFVGEAQALDLTILKARPMPEGLVWVCAYSDSESRCVDTVFESPVIVDCNNQAPITEYQSGPGVMVVWDALGEPQVYHYGQRFWQQTGGPGNLPTIAVFAEAGPYGTEFPPHKGDFEGLLCRMFVRE
jgi:hypothetical protein